MSKVSRRTFLASTAVAAASTALPRRAVADTPAATPAPPATTGFGPPTPVPAGVTLKTIEEGEKLAVVQFRPEQRKLLLDSLGDQLAWPVQRRKTPLPQSLAPASKFSPLLPGMAFPSGKSALVRPKAAASPVPKTDDDLAFASVAELSRWLHARQLTSTRLTQACLDRLERLQPKLLCTITLAKESALKAAAEADRELAAGKYRGPLHGVPFGAKDLLDSAGLATTWGAEPFRSRVPERDAAVLARLKAAGAILVAKLSLGALAMNDVWFGGQTKNPWLLDEGSSGSSAGSASAVAAGCVPFAIGSETLGSIVSPSIRCGVTGLRPTFGRVPRTGAMPLCWTLDKLGPMARRVEDVALVLAALDGADPGDPASVSAPLVIDLSLGTRRLKVGYDPAWLADKDAVPEDKAALELLRGAGVELVEIATPKLPYDSMLPILFAESAASFEELTLSHQDDELKMQVADAWPNLWRSAHLISAVELVQADRLRRVVMEAWAKIFDGVDALAGPALAGPMLTITNFTGHPCLTLRTGFRDLAEVRSDFAQATPQKLSPKRRVPHGLSLWARLYDEGTLLRLGLALEEKAGVWRERPAI